MQKCTRLISGRSLSVMSHAKALPNDHPFRGLEGSSENLSSIRCSLSHDVMDGSLSNAGVVSRLELLPAVVLGGQ